MTAQPEVERCARHPNVETGLRCGRCETLICPQCMVYTPAGVRCPDCARMRRLPMYELRLTHYARAVGIAVVLAALLGFAGALLTPYLLPAPGRTLLFGFLIALLAGMGAGSLMASALYRGTGGKRGRPVQAIAIAALAAAGLLRFALLGVPWEVLPQDITGFILVGAAALTASGRLR